MDLPCFDLVIIGSGFGGALLSLIGRRQGRSVLLLERGRHPRFVIGESSTPLANFLWEQLSDRYALPRLRPLSKWGTWQREYPHLACGLKRGFSFFHHTRGQTAVNDTEHRMQLLVAASDRDEVADTHWYRPDLDAFMVDEAQREGVEYWDEVQLRSVSIQSGASVLEGDRLGAPLSVQACFVVDASGSRGFLHRALQFGELPLEHLPETQSLYTHFRGVRSLEGLGLIPPGETPPYPIDAAAVHHVFNGGWIWVLRFNNGIVSAGVAATNAVAKEFEFSDGAPAWARLLQAFPAVEAQFSGAQPVRPFIYAPRLAFRCARVSGAGWALLPSAAGFIDPLMSTGFTLNLLGIERLASMFEQHWGEGQLVQSLESYARDTIAELLAVERLVGALYSSMGDFEVFSSMALLYFAAVSFAEIRARSGQPVIARSFLLHDHPTFGPAAREICNDAIRLARTGRLSPEQRRSLSERVLDAIRPIDLIGLGRSDRRNWHPVAVGTEPCGAGAVDLA